MENYHLYYILTDMRIIAGKFGKLQFNAPKGHRTHPMSDRVRGALFNSLGDISGLSILDAFAGTGALSFEAISRGAAKTISIDIDKNAVDVMRETVAKFGISDQCKVIRANASGWSDNNSKALFDIVIAAPPYDNLQHTVVQKLTKHMKDDGMFILDWPASQETPVLNNLQLIDARKYGNAQIAFYKKSTSS